MPSRQGKPDVSRTEQAVQNWSFDEDFQVLATEGLVYNPVTGNLDRMVQPSGEARFGTNNIDEASSTLTYVGKEDKDGVWVIQKIDTSSGTTITYATQTNNPTYTSYYSAWTNRSSLIYGSYKEAF